MANRNIAFTITINGVEKTVSTIGELEAALRQARVELKNFTGDDAARQRLINDIRNADKVVKDFNQSIKGNAIDIQINKFIQFGSAVVSAFAAAQTALSLFGRDSVAAAEAQVKAQQLLTVAIAAGDIARQADTFETVANTVAKIANIAATQGLTAASKALFAVLKANPFQAILSVVTLVVGSLIFFTDRTDKAKVATEKFNRELEQINTTFNNQIALLQAQGASEEDVARARLAQATAIRIAKEDELARLRSENRVSEEAEKARLEAIQAKADEETAAANLKRVQEDNAKKDAKELNDIEKRIAEERKARLLEELRLKGELRKIELDRITQGIQLELPDETVSLEQQNDALKSLIVSQDEYNTALKKYQSLQQGLGPNQLAGDLKPSPELLNQLEITRQLIKSSVELAGLPIDSTISTLRDLLKTQQGFVDGTYNNYQGYVETQRNLLQFERDFIASFVETNIKGFEGSAEAVAQQRKILAEQGQVVLENLLENAGQINDLTKAYSDLQKKIQDLQTENANLAKSTEVLNGFLKQNEELLTQSFDIPIKFGKSAKSSILTLEKEIATKRFDEAKQFASDIEVLEYNLLQNGIDVRNASYEQKLQLLLAFIKKEVEATEQGEKDKQDAFQKTIDKIQNSIQAFQIGLQAVQQTVSDYYNFQFDLLEKRNKRVQDTIVGTSEAANKKRLEQEKIYTAERARLEKQQAKISLRIALAQTIANTAEAVARNISIPPLAILVGIAGAAQAAIITAQLNQIDSYKRGGRVRLSKGGMVNGPSHEMGGVKFQGGGIELEGNEAVINRLSTLQYADILSTINQAGGGRPIVMNGFDDSRIVEAIAKQRQTPIRAYVVESDITNAQTINKRLELLSQI